jgi:TolB-like protein
MSLNPGTKLGAYEIRSKLGQGGMGEVYRAADSKLGRDVAIKVLPAEMAAAPGRLERFQREARALAALDHPGIVSVFSVEEAGGIHFLTMQLVEGETLDTLIAAGGLSLSRFFDIAVPLAEALSAAHERGIVHRDLKPGNVMVTREGRVKVLDFGLASRRPLDAAGREQAAAEQDPMAEVNVTAVETVVGSPDMTEPGTVMGTVAYMSPEQARGGSVDARSDVFSAGVLLYELLTGERPFRGASAVDLISSILRDAPPSVTELRADLPPHLGRILRHCLEKEPRDRYQTSRDVYNELKELRAEWASSSPTVSPRSWAAARPASGALRADEGSVAAAGGGRAIGRRPAVAAAAGAAVLLGLVVYLAARSRAVPAASGAPEPANAPSVIRSIAVLPLDNYSGDPAQDYFAEGMTDELTADLATISQLRVISRGSAMQFKGGHRPPTPEIAKMLNVDAIVEGSVLRAGDKVRITAQLIDARADRHLWAKSFERSSRDVLALQDEMASAIAREIHVQLTPDERSRLTRAPSVNAQAHDAYLKGRYFFNRPSDENLKKAIEQFEEAVKRDPTFALAFSGLSDAYLWAAFNEGVLTAAEGNLKAKAAAEKAIQLDDASAEGHTSLAVYKVWYEYDWEGSEREFRKAFALNPNYAFAHDQFGLGLAFQGRLDESVAEGRRAAELDPLDPQIPIDNLMALAWQRKYQEAKEEARKASVLDPTFFFAPWGNGWVDIQAGNVSDAIPEFRKARALESPPFVAAWLGYAYGASGDRKRAMAAIEELKNRSLHGYVPPFNVAIVYLGLGDRARALEYLERAYAANSQWLIYIKGDRIFDPLRSEPRFIALLKKLHFDK